MLDQHIGKSFSFPQISAAYQADPPDDQFYVLHRGGVIVALCLRQKFNPILGEVWVGNDPAVAEWGRQLAAFKIVVPVFYSIRQKSYEFKGHFLVTGDTTSPQELAKRQGPVPLSRIVFIEQIHRCGFQIPG